MNREEALAVLNTKLDDYRKMSYADLAAKIGHEEFPEVVGSSGTEYQIEIHVTWDHKPDGDVRVMGTIDDGTFRGAFRPVPSPPAAIPTLVIRPARCPWPARSAGRRLAAPKSK